MGCGPLTYGPSWNAPNGLKSVAALCRAAVEVLIAGSEGSFIVATFKNRGAAQLVTLLQFDSRHFPKYLHQKLCKPNDVQFQIVIGRRMYSN
jgi:hypothetical protein